MEGIVKRIKEFMALNHITENSLSKKIDLNQPSINYYLNGKRKPSVEFLLMMLNSYPEISAEWLMRGEGEMLKSNSSNDGDGAIVGDLAQRTEEIMMVKLMLKGSSTQEELALVANKMEQILG